MTTEGSKKAILDLYRAVARETKNGAALGEQKEAFKHFLADNPPKVDVSGWKIPGQLAHNPLSYDYEPALSDDDRASIAAWEASRDRHLAEKAEEAAREQKVAKVLALIQKGKYEKAQRKLTKLIDDIPEED